MTTNIGGGWSSASTINTWATTGTTASWSGDSIISYSWEQTQICDTCGLSTLISVLSDTSCHNCVGWKLRQGQLFTE